MTPPTPAPTPSRGIHWIWLVVALVLGLLLGRVLFYKAPGGELLGTCTTGDTTIVARNVTEPRCLEICPGGPGCTWTQNP